MRDALPLFWQLLAVETGHTLYMVLAAGLCALLAGLPLGVLLTVTSRGHLMPSVSLHRALDTLVNIGRSIPFAILIVALIPLTRYIVGSSLGTSACIVPLAIAATPFFARVVDTSLKEVDRATLEAATVMGSSTWQIIFKVLLREALPSLVHGFTLTLVNLISYSAMAGLVGGGGLGKIAIQYGYLRFDGTLMVTTVCLLVCLVQIVEWLGAGWVRAIKKKRGIALHE